MRLLKGGSTPPGDAAAAGLGGGRAFAWREGGRGALWVHVVDATAWGPVQLLSWVAQLSVQRGSSSAHGQRTHNTLTTHPKHTHYVQCLGTFITEFKLGQQRCTRLFGSRDSAQTAAEQLAAIAAHYGFDVSVLREKLAGSWPARGFFQSDANAKL